MNMQKIDIDVYRHSASHIMAFAVKKLFPKAKLAIGPSIEDGFYYDFEVDVPFTPDDLARIEEEMDKIVKENISFERKELSKEDALKLFQDSSEEYKVELIKDLPEGTISIYSNNDFIDLCKGPHISSTGDLKCYKLLSVAGAYWRGDEHNKMLQRIYGTAFFDKKSLRTYLHKLEEARKRDHRKIGKELDLYSIHEEGGAGLIYWHPKGGRLRNTIETFWRDVHYRHGYDVVYTPHIAKLDLWKKSGHWDFYKENLYSPMDIDGKEYIVKPMNCPGHILMYKTKLRSYRDLPLRWAELGTVYRYEKSGVLHGLMRVRGFTQDDAHIFCTLDQLKDEIISVISLARYMMELFGFQYEINLSTQPEKFVGSSENWEKSTAALTDALQSLEIEYKVDPGEGVFYGPKIDIKMIDALGRGWQGPTIQVDFNIPERFDVNYIAEDGKAHQVVMVHRTVLGSMERFIGVLIEHFAGDFPVWLAPIQVKVMPISDDQKMYAKKVSDTLRNKGIYTVLDDRNEKIGYKIREAELEKIPYMLVIGAKEAEQEAVSVRRRKIGDLGVKKTDEFISALVEEIALKK
ncbi:MAG: threonine--tRNA ligase [Candidatus Ancaeobacter aquaticus]|nr:threonine--tRNA ligase [Candidatus Ancaeobacter aquaticus]